MTRRFLRVLAMTLALSASTQMVLVASPASAAFEKLKSLAGDWQGKDEEGNAVKTNFKLIAGQTAVMETLTASGMDEMVTLYSVDGDGIALLHYCPTNNQPRMRAIPSPGAIEKLDFSFQGARNLPSPGTGHEHRLVIQFQDRDHITERWTWRKNGKDTEMVYQFARQPAN